MFPLPHVPARRKREQADVHREPEKRKSGRALSTAARIPCLAHRERQNLFRAGLRTCERHASEHAVERCLPMLRTVACDRSEISLTVAGAVPALLHEQRTGFPFHPLGINRGDTWNAETLSVAGVQGKLSANIALPMKPKRPFSVIDFIRPRCGTCRYMPNTFRGWRICRLEKSRLSTMPNEHNI